MSDTTLHEGQCLCGAVTVRVTAPLRVVDVCHCASCRKTTGGGPFFGMGVPKAAVTFDGGEQIAIYRSSDHAERGFCRACGTNLFFRMAGDAASEHISLCPGLFDPLEDLQVASEMFIDAKPHLYSVEGDHPRITHAQARSQLDAFLEKQRAAREDPQ